MRRVLSWLPNAQERFERTPLGQGLISGLIVTAVLTGIVWNLPDSPIRQRAMTVILPIGSASGLGQGWNVFAPNPPRRADYLSVVVTFADGHETTWRAPMGDPLVGHYSTERWHKLREYLTKTPSLRPTFARWVVREVAGPSGGAVRVRIVDRIVTLPPPGSAVPAKTTVRTLYDEKLAGTR